MIDFGPWPGPPGDGGGGGGFFSSIYAAGVADVPSVDNLMTGTLQQFFINLGATPPPFPPTNPLFFPEAALTVGENPADTGVGADSKPLWRFRRWFSTFPSVGDQLWQETRYDLFGSGINTITGGDRNQHVLVDQFENRLTFMMDVSQLTRPGLNAPGYTPIYLDNAPVSYRTVPMLDALGSGNTNDWTWNSDGAQFRRAFIPNVIGPGGGPAGPWNFVADAMSIWARNAGEPLVGSRLYYDAITVQTFGNVSDDDQHLIVAQSAVLDAKNLGSGQAAGHGETWVRSTLGGALTLVASYYDDLVDIPVEVIGHNGAVFIGGVTADGTLVSTGDANVGGDAHVTGAETVGGNIDVGGFGTLDGASMIHTYESAEVDLTATSTDTEIVPARSGFYFCPVPSSNGVRLRVTAKAGTLSTQPTMNVGNNVAKTNYFPSASVNLATPFANGVGNLSAIGGGPNTAMADLATSIKADVTVAATGSGLTFKGKFSISGYYVAV